jgi:hypothetical protein
MRVNVGTEAPIVARAARSGGEEHGREVLT